MAAFDRRDFLKLVGVGAGGAAAATGCEPVEKLIPYVIQPEEITPGIPVVYASTCQECSAGCGLHVSTREGRPIKLEGNPDHPVNKGALCARGQAGIGRSYHPDRYKAPKRRGADGDLADLAWEEAISLFATRVKEAGSGTYVLGGPVGPTLSSLIDRWVDAVGGGGRVVYEPFAHESLPNAVKALYGEAQRPLFDLSGTDFVLDFGSDFLESWVSPTEHARQLEDSRDVGTEAGRGARLVYVGPRLSMTAGNADEWLPARPGSEGVLALGLARAAWDAGVAGRGGENEGVLESVLTRFSPDKVAQQTDVPAETIRRIGKALAQSKRPVALPPGVALTGPRATATTAAVLLLNAAIGAMGKAVQLAPADGGSSSYREVLALVDRMKRGDVRVLVIHDSNPLYSLPPEAGFAEALDKVDFVVSTASLPDETSEKAHLILPDHTPLESWGDASPRPGVRSLVQPTLRPLYDTQSLGDVLLAAGRETGASDLPEGSFRGVIEAAWSGTDFRAALARGGDFESVPGSAVPALSPAAARIAFEAPKLSGDGAFTLVAYPSPMLSDGSGAHLPLLQETPDPVTKIAWQSWAEISHNAAEKLGVRPGDVVSVETPAGSLQVSVLPRGGIRDDVVAIPLGQGHSVGLFASRGAEGEPREIRGVNPITILPAATDEDGGRAWLAARASVRPTGDYERLAITQTSDNKRGRQLGEAVTLASLAAANGNEAHFSGEEEEHGGDHGDHHLKPFDAAADALPDSAYRWGLTIDLDRCSGCSACVVACNIENNIPTVGEDAVLRARQMSWIRIERFIGDGYQQLEIGRPDHKDHEELGNVDVRNSVMLCQQCGAASCEPVCPVIATYHNPEGLNGMIYNRCIGTRYCSNNCPYKVRRYNWFDYQIENWPEPMRLGLNPDVTVRAQGVMEKCTFCIQRIQAARQPAKDEGREIRDGEVTPACAQTCPTQAIVFGNLRDEKSRAVQKAKAGASRSYHALHVLNTRPAVNYLSVVKRGPEGGEA